MWPFGLSCSAVIFFARAYRTLLEHSNAPIGWIYYAHSKPFYLQTQRTSFMILFAHFADTPLSERDWRSTWDGLFDTLSVHDWIQYRHTLEFYVHIPLSNDLSPHAPDIPEYLGELLTETLSMVIRVALSIQPNEEKKNHISTGERFLPTRYVIEYEADSLELCHFYTASQRCWVFH